MRYGDEKTLHRSGKLNVETDATGKVVAVWFRCLSLPFTQDIASNSRATEMRESYQEYERPEIIAIEVTNH